MTHITKSQVNECAANIRNNDNVYREMSEREIYTAI